MGRRSILYTCAIAALTSGCYLDVRGGVEHAGGGVSGYGWELAMTGGVGFDFGHIVRPSVAAEGAMTRINGRDGKFGSTGLLSYHARLDVTLSSEEIDHDEIAAAHPGMMIPEGNALGMTRIVLDYGYGKEDLQFIAPDDPMIYKSQATVHRMYLGLAREYDVSSVQASFSIGPNVTLIPNEFVGNTTIIGGQFHSSFWFFPALSWKKKSGNYKSDYTPSDVEKPISTPSPTKCRDRFGGIHDC